MADPAPPTIPGYELAPPTEADAVHALARHFGRERAEAIWHAALRAAGVRRTGGTLLAAELAPVAEVLKQQEGVVRVIGRSLAIRVSTYLLLQARLTPPYGGAAVGTPIESAGGAAAGAGARASVPSAADDDDAAD